MQRHLEIAEQRGDEISEQLVANAARWRGHEPRRVLSAHRLEGEPACDVEAPRGEMQRLRLRFPGSLMAVPLSAPRELPPPTAGAQQPRDAPARQYLPKGGERLRRQTALQAVFGRVVHRRDDEPAHRPCGDEPEHPSHDGEQVVFDRESPQRAHLRLSARASAGQPLTRSSPFARRSSTVLGDVKIASSGA